MAPSPTIVCLVYTMNDWPELQKPYASKDMNVFYNDSKTEIYDVTTLQNSRSSRVPNTFLVD